MLFARLWRKVFYKIINTVICNFKDCRLEFIFNFSAYDKICSKVQDSKGDTYSRLERVHLEKRRKLATG